MPQDLSALIAKLREASAGYDEWRVQDPKDGSYCIAYSWPESVNPEREARAWLADHKARFPGGLHSGFVVACVRVVNAADRLRLDAADALEAQAAEIARLRADATAHAVQYISLTDAMGYTAGPQGLSPEEFATALRVDAERWRHGVAHGFPFRGPQWIARTQAGRPVFGDTANEAIDAAREST